jgi:hypothetical protein
MSQKLFQVRGEIMHEFSVLEYLVRSYLAHLLATQQERPSIHFPDRWARLSRGRKVCEEAHLDALELVVAGAGLHADRY